MKVIKTFFDEVKYAEDVKRTYSELKNHSGVANFDISHPYPYTDEELFKMAVSKVERGDYETTVEYLYLNAVAESDGRPLLIVYNEEEGVKTIYADNCKLVQE